jgi:hypothetical protein
MIAMQARSRSEMFGGFRMATGLKLFDLFLIASAAVILLYKFAS